ncbi:MAG: hypothetical protein LBP74_09840 [Treponema sp.]|jgi:hypothetical protein|nr:hypothetical protein [Treponema sp.]
MPLRHTLLIIFAAAAMPVFGQIRSFASLFAAYDGAVKKAICAPNGILEETKKDGEIPPVPKLLPPFLSGSGIADPILNQDPSFLVESLMVIPLDSYSSGMTGIYNALSRVGDLKGRMYHSFTRDKDVPLFEDAVRLEGEKKLSPLPDPPARSSVPREETIFMRLKDANVGKSYYRADIAAGQWGLFFSFSNFRNITYLLIPVIRENKFLARLYIEPISEGILIYAIAGVDISDFVASRIDMPSAIQKRLAVIIEWIADGIRKTY